MAKTTKVASKRTTGSKSNNTNNSKGFFGKSFDLKNRKVQFFVVILIVAILGGGYFTFKSFAATTSYMWSQNSPGIRIYNNNCAINNIQEPSKNYKTVWNIACPSNGLAVIYSPTMNRLPRGKYKVCTMAKGGGRLSLIHEGTGYEPTKTVSLVNDGNYHEYCTAGSGSRTKLYDHNATILIEPSSWVSISYISLIKL